MPANIELKARIRFPEKLTARVRELAGDPEGTFSQEDIFFRVPRGRLKMRTQSGSEKEFIFYQREEGAIPMYSAYFRTAPSNPTDTEIELRRLFEAKGTVRKTRTLYWLHGARIHVDNVEGLGHFLEVEVPVGDPARIHQARALADKIISSLNISATDFVCQAYEELLGNPTARPSGTAPAVD